MLLSDKVYKPSDDSYILTKTISDIDNCLSIALELGSGSGYVSIYRMKKCKKSYTIMVDISPCSVRSSWESAKINGIDDLVDVIQCDAGTCIRSMSIDTIYFNPPYLPVEEFNDILSISWSGGIDGIIVWSKFFNESYRICRDNCKIIFIVSSLQDIGKIIDILSSMCSEIEFYMCKEFFFETICSVITRCKR